MASDINTKEIRFPLKELASFEGNIYEITVAASHRALQIAYLKDRVIERTHAKIVSYAAQQLFFNEVKYKIEDKQNLE